MRISSFLLVVLVLTVAVYLPDSSGAVTQEDPVDLDDTVIVESYKKISSTHLVIGESTKSSYQNVVIYAFTSQPVTVSVNGSDLGPFTPSGTGIKLLLHFDEGEEVDLRVSLGSDHHDYSFTVRKSISIKELDPEEEDEEIFYSVGELVTVCCLVFAASGFGIYGMFRFYKRRAMREVRTLGPE